MKSLQLADRRHIVYVVRDLTGVVLYVGMTGDFTNRMYQHSRSYRLTWPHRPHTIQRIRVRNRRQARDLEARLIRDLLPIENSTMACAS